MNLVNYCSSHFGGAVFTGGNYLFKMCECKCMEEWKNRLVSSHSH